MSGIDSVMKLWLGAVVFVAVVLDLNNVKIFEIFGPNIFTTCCCPKLFFGLRSIISGTMGKQWDDGKNQRDLHIFKDRDVGTVVAASRSLKMCKSLGFFPSSRC